MSPTIHFDRLDPDAAVYTLIHADGSTEEIRQPYSRAVAPPVDCLVAVGVAEGTHGVGVVAMMTHAEALARTSRLSTDALLQVVRLARHPNPERLAFDSGHILTPDGVADILACRALMDPDNDRHAMAERFAVEVLGWTLEPEVAPPNDPRRPDPRQGRPRRLRAPRPRPGAPRAHRGNPRRLRPGARRVLGRPGAGDRVDAGSDALPVIPAEPVPALTLGPRRKASLRLVRVWWRSARRCRWRRSWVTRGGWHDWPV